MHDLRLALRLADCVNDVCPVTGRAVSADALARYKGRVVGFANRAARDAFVGALVAFETAIQPAPRFCPPAPAEARAFAA
jgi:hypothetical protein